MAAKTIQTNIKSHNQDDLGVRRHVRHEFVQPDISHLETAAKGRKFTNARPANIVEDVKVFVCVVSYAGVPESCQGSQ